MKASELKEKTVDELGEELLKLRKEQFNLRLQQATGQLTRPHEYRRVRRDIARVKTVLKQLSTQGEAK